MSITPEEITRIKDALDTAQSKMENAIHKAVFAAMAEFKAETNLTPSSIDIRLIENTLLFGRQTPEYVLTNVRARYEL